LLRKEQSNNEERRLRYSLFSIEALIFLLPCLIIAFICYRNNVLLKFSQMAVIAFALVLILAGLIILRQIFDSFYIIARTIKKIEDSEENILETKRETYNLREITVSFDRLMGNFEDTTNELKRRIKELFAIRELNEIASRVLEIDELLTVLLEKAMEISRTRIGSILMFESEKKRFRVVALRGLKPGPEKDLFTDIDESTLQKIMSERKPLFVQSIITNSGKSKAENNKEKSLSLLRMPIFIRNSLMAVLNIGYKETIGVSYSKDEQILSIMIGEIGFALDNALLHSRMEESLKELQARTSELADANEHLQREITERKVAEEEKRKLEGQLQMAQRLEAIGTLAGGIAHNFNNLLMGIQGNISLLLLDLHSADPKFKRLENIEKLVKSGSKLTAQLLGYARKGRYEVRPISLNQLVLDVSETFVMARKEIRFHQKLAEDLFCVIVDQNQIEQVLLNLYINAADAMSGSGDLYLETMNVTHEDFSGKCYNPKPGNYVMFKIRDTGKGMDKKTVEHIFEPFFTTKDIDQGTGLGLASTYGIIKGHGGYIDVESELNQGTTFSIYLPASEEQIPNDFKTAEFFIEGRGTILVVDDEEMVLDTSTMLIRKLGYSVIEAKSGIEAIKVLENNKGKIDMIILDMIMPDMGGNEVYDRIKEIDPDMKVLLSSGYGIDGMASDILKRGCNGFIQKPYNIKELSQKVKDILHKK